MMRVILPKHSSSMTSAAIRRLLTGLSPSGSPRLGVTSSSRSYAARSLSTSSSNSDVSSFLTPEEQAMVKKGLLDERGLTQFTTLHEMQVVSCAAYAEKPLFGTYEAVSGQFAWQTFGEYAQRVHQCRALLQDLGIGPYDKVGIISNNRWEWAALAAASYSLNANLVPMYEAQLPSDWSYILNDSGAKLVICANADIFDKVQKDVLPQTPLVQHALALDVPQEGGDAVWNVDTCSANPNFDVNQLPAYSFARRLASVSADTESKLVQAPLSHDLANLIYTSGTTGKPKGVELTHENFATNVQAAARSLVSHPRVDDLIRPDDVSLAFLPWAHSYGQTCELWLGMSHGCALGVCRGVPSILEDLQLVQPTVLYAVPTLYKKIYDGVHNLMETSSPLRKRLMKSALSAGHESVAAERGERPPLGWLERVQLALYNRLVLSKIQARFGGRLRHGFVAGAACPAEVLQFMDDIGIPICEGYGLTETSPIITINTPTQRQVGSVGSPIGGVQVYIVDEDGQPLPPGAEGEICCVGPNVMRGYYKNPEATAEVISTAPDGTSRMFHTGDLGRMGEDGFVKVTGRLKEQYKLENGKYVCPTPIEEAIGMSRFISQVVLCGANRPHNTALLVPDWAAIRTHLKIQDDASMSDNDLAHDDRVRALIDDEIAAHTTRLKKFEVPQAWSFVAPFTAANNMLTPKMSIRRHKVIQTYADVIAHLYGDEEENSDEASNAKSPSDDNNAAAA